MAIQLPNIPALSSKVDTEVRRAFDSIKGWLNKIGSDGGMVTQGSLSDDFTALLNTGPLAPLFDGTIPPQIQNLVVTGAFRTIMLEWDDPRYRNLSYVEVWRHTTDDLGAAQMVGTTVSTIYSDDPPNSSLLVDYYYWVRAVSVSGIKGAFNATSGTKGNTANDPAYVLELLKGQLGYGDFAAGVYPVRVVTSLPSLPATLYPQGVLVLLTTDNQLYRSTGTAWTVAIPAVNITGQLTDAQIAAGAITTAKIAAGAITASELAANAVTAGKIAAGAIVAGDAVIANSAIANAHIIDGTITNAKIASLAADKLYASSGTIASAIIGAAHITNAMIDTLNATKITAGYIDAARINTDTITADKILSKSATYFTQDSYYCANGVSADLAFYMDHAGYVAIIFNANWSQLGSGGTYSGSLSIDSGYAASASGSWSSSAAPAPPGLMISGYYAAGWHNVNVTLTISTATGDHLANTAIFRSYR